jgi:hypothetical protein
MKNSAKIKRILTIFTLCIFLSPLQAFSFTLEDFSTNIGTGNINGFNSDFFSLSNSNIETESNGSTSSGATDLTFTNQSAINFDSLIITFDAMSPHTVVHNGGQIETSPGSGVFLNYINHGSLASGSSLTTPFSLTANGSSAFGQVTSAKYNVYTNTSVSGPGGSTPEPSTYLLVILALLFSTQLVLRKNRNDTFFGK